MSIRPKWLRDACSILFSVYYIIYAHEADEKVRPTLHPYLSTGLIRPGSFVSSAPFQQWKCFGRHGRKRQIHMCVCLRTDFAIDPHKVQIRALTYYPPVTIRKKILLPRPSDATYHRPVTAWLFFAPPEHHLSRATDLILDFPGGGFISMTPEHHEDRLRMWAMRTGKPVLSIEYGKAPECEWIGSRTRS